VSKKEIALETFSMLVLITAIVILFLSGPVSAFGGRLIIIGDSISSTDTSWPTYIPGAQVMAQPGRLIRDYQPPRDIHSTTGERIVYFLGGNDIGNQSVHGGNPKIARQLLLDHLHFLTGRGFKVLVVIPPLFDIHNLDQSNRKHRQMFKSLRGTIKGVEFIDINPVWDTSQTSDGIHPLPSLSKAIAHRIRARLASL